MNLEEMFEEAKRRWPKKDIHCSRYLSVEDEKMREWWWVSVREMGKYDGPSASGDSPQEALSKIVLPDRISEARMMIDKANEILREEGVIPAQ
jgi:hypothetical protein